MFSVGSSAPRAHAPGQGIEEPRPLLLECGEDLEQVFALRLEPAEVPEFAGDQPIREVAVLDELLEELELHKGLFVIAQCRAPEVHDREPDEFEVLHIETSR